MDNTSLEVLNLGSITGVVVATMFIVEILKRVLANVSGFSKIPVFIYASVIAVILALCANRIHTSDGSVLLQGSTAKVLWAALIAALGSSGFYTWLRSPQSVENSNNLTTPSNKSLILLLPIMLFMVGCACPEKVTLREGLDRSSKNMWKNQLDWTAKLVVDPATGKDHRDELPKLSPNDLISVQKAKAEFDGLISDDRARPVFGAPTTNASN